MGEDRPARFPQRKHERWATQSHDPKNPVSRLGRREAIAILASLAAWPLAIPAVAKENRKHIGVLISIAESDEEGHTRLAAFQDSLRKLGWTAGHNLDMDVRWGGGDADRIQRAAAELADLKPDAILASGTSVVRALQAQAIGIPIVFVQVADPVGAGMVASMEHPGGNITGFANINDALAAKWLQLLKEAAPRLTRVVIIRNPVAASAVRMLHAIEAVAPTLGVDLNPVSAVEPADIKLVTKKFARQPNVGLIVLPDAIVTVNRDLIISLAAQYQLPAIYPFRFFATAGGLMSYGVDTVDEYRRAAAYVSRILRGESPAKLPVQEPSKFDLVINLATAKALGLALAPTLLERANEVLGDSATEH
jgi:putative tryptophan/tyrosine transport system substrate-binding protein